MTEAQPLIEVSLDDKYTRTSGRVFMTGIQALVRLPLEQRRRDLARGHDTAGYISGYRGSPLGALDQQLERAAHHLAEHQVEFRPGVNEDIAATACWGTQQAELDGEGRYDGVFALWYGKGPGVDRSGDALRHANLAGTSALGGVLALLGDDHTCESSTTSHHSEYAMVDAMIPVLNPAGVQEILDYGLFGWAMSRFTGCWVSLKCVHDTVEAAASVDVDTARVRVQWPQSPPAGSLSIRWPDTPQEQERRLHEEKIEAARRFCRANNLDRTIWSTPSDRVGIVTTGKSYLDVRQALDDLGIDEATAARLGLRLYKVAMPFPLEPEGIRDFCQGLRQVIVVEEKRSLIESQLKDLLFGDPQAPGVVGKRDERGAALFRSAGRLDTNHIAVEIARRLLEAGEDGRLRERMEALSAVLAAPPAPDAALARTPYFCPGCPHNTSTRVPAGSKALAGIGCHYLAQFMDRSTERYTHMGGEGASWIGQSLFVNRKHVFQNIGDGTYYHSGVMSIRAAIAAEVNVTFKILFNDAVAMTGGQSMDGPLTVPAISRQMLAEGARRVVVVTDEPEKFGSGSGLGQGVTVYHRRELDAVQRRLREIAGTTVLIYDQTCAAEKRRRRKRGRFPDPPKRVFINESVCEGCGDCGVKSNCVAVVPLETPLGRKRAIDQSACNKDFSCLDGFCPSFVSVHGGRPRRGIAVESKASAPIPEPERPGLDRPYQTVITGVGGTGVITIGALIGMAAHLESRGVSILDQTGLAQKGGAVVSHIRVANEPGQITATRIANGSADAVIGCDLVVTGSPDVLSMMKRGRTRVVLNSHRTMTGDFTRNPDLVFPFDALGGSIEAVVGAKSVSKVEATRIATALMGDGIAANMFMLGVAYQQGLVPVSSAAIERAIELNAVAVEMNRKAFEWGRRSVHDPESISTVAERARTPDPLGLDALIEHRAGLLVDYQNEAYAGRYRSMVDRVRDIVAVRVPGRTELVEAVAKGYYKLLAYKDEYEVARLYADPRFRERVEAAFEGDYTLGIHLAPPLLARRDPTSGEPRKREFGPWMLRVFEWIAPLRVLRGTPLDPFSYTAERRMERRLIRDYESLLDEILAKLDAGNHGLAVDLAALPEQIRGFGHVKRHHVELAEKRRQELIEAFHAPPQEVAAA